MSKLIVLCKFYLLLYFRSLYASLVGKKTLFKLPAYYYEISESALAAKSANPSNKCFCKRFVFTLFTFVFMFGYYTMVFEGKHSEKISMLQFPGGYEVFIIITYIGRYLKNLSR